MGQEKSKPEEKMEGLRPLTCSVCPAQFFSTARKCTCPHIADQPEIPDSRCPQCAACCLCGCAATGCSACSKQLQYCRGHQQSHLMDIQNHVLGTGTLDPNCQSCYLQTRTGSQSYFFLSNSLRPSIVLFCSAECKDKWKCPRPDCNWRNVVNLPLVGGSKQWDGSTVLQLCTRPCLATDYECVMCESRQPCPNGPSDIRCCPGCRKIVCHGCLALWMVQSQTFRKHLLLYGSGFKMWQWAASEVSCFDCFTTKWMGTGAGESKRTRRRQAQLFRRFKLWRKGTANQLRPLILGFPNELITIVMDYMFFVPDNHFAEKLPKNPTKIDRRKRGC